MLHKQIAGLRRTLKEEENFGSIMSAFLDISESDPEFISESMPVHPKCLTFVLAHGVGSALGKKVNIACVIAVEFKKEQLIHGAFFSDSGPGTFFYFRDLQMGLSALSRGDTQLYFRMTIEQWDEEGNPVDHNPIDADPAAS